VQGWRSGVRAGGAFWWVFVREKKKKKKGKKKKTANYSIECNQAWDRPHKETLVRLHRGFVPLDVPGAGLVDFRVDDLPSLSPRHHLPKDGNALRRKRH